jgi:toxin ParE1/3/4
MSIEWTEPALADLVAIRAYLRSRRPRAAERMIQRIIDLVDEQLLEMPESGRRGRVEGTRELVVSGSPYIVAYRGVSGGVQVLRVIHGARRWPDSF